MTDCHYSGAPDLETDIVHNVAKRCELIFLKFYLVFKDTTEKQDNVGTMK